MTSKKSVNVQAAETIGSMVSRGKISAGKKGKASGKRKSAQPAAPAKPGKTPSAKNVKAALKGGHIKPAEAASLNPRGGLTARSKDVKSALGAGHITYDEAKSLNPNAFKKK